MLFFSEFCNHRLDRHRSRTFEEGLEERRNLELPLDSSFPHRVLKRRMVGLGGIVPHKTLTLYEHSHS